MTQTSGEDDVERMRLARVAARSGLAAAGEWLSGAERIEAWQHVRDAESNELDQARLAALSPTAVEGRHGPGRLLNGTDVEVVHRVASDPGRLTRSWAEEAIADIGEERYTELVAVVSVARVLDRFDDAIGDPRSPLPAPIEGEPTRVRPDDVGDVGAWVSQSLAPALANVSRTFSLVPTTNRLWRGLVDSHYSRGPQFLEWVWHRALSRPQVELVAARTTSLNECFY
ncbi:MAG: alkylhydroperoxidase-related (seleno)protein [Actinomycetota bacterium]|nr:alkylhydroperoxidase-related (seleno)protein [Actinomycetota bacterium]